MKNTLRIAAAAILLAQLALASGIAYAMEANLVFVRAARVSNPWGGFSGVPGGGIMGDEPSCRFLKGVLSKKSGALSLEHDPGRHQKKLKARVQEIFRSEFMQEIVERVARVRKLAYPGISDDDSRTILTLVHDCAFDTVGSGPAVLPLKSEKSGAVTYEGKPVHWVLVLSNAEWGTIDDAFGGRNAKFRIPDDVLAHELTHGMTADLLRADRVDASNEQKVSKAHDVDLVSDPSMAFWEGVSEGVEATIGERLKGAFAYPYSADPGVYGLLLERQQPVRDNRFAFEKDGRPKNGSALVRSEGFIATLTYRILSTLSYKLPDGMVLEGWPFQELAKAIREIQPINTIELLGGLMARGESGLGVTREFLKISGFVTFAPEAMHLHAKLTASNAQVDELNWKVQRNPEDAALRAELSAARAQNAALRSDWDVKSALWLAEALGPSRPSPLRLLGN